MHRLISKIHPLSKNRIFQAVVFTVDSHISFLLSKFLIYMYSYSLNNSGKINDTTLPLRERTINNRR